ncbi:MAG: tRNA preQ1(34) S-adenosylmethionine ribosyltransferase-isomerase QueA [Spirochaetaceae bacterium]|jgi:S-adenosylmethionine:tRNA ribosyltransferase-isomerase|nr:tRNA preQ1(34) S-adenosylmethionine ribosyltransferase-isomerase QueA [Spirochaetaceae bacterium]
MKTKDFYFDLPKEQIAQYPAGRGESRLLVLNRLSGQRHHHTVKELPNFIERGSLLVFNDSRVRKARIFGRDSHDKKIEFLLINPVKTPEKWTVIVKKASKKLGGRFRFADETEAELEYDAQNGFMLRFDHAIDDAWLDQHGHIPLPPYIKRADETVDANRYQTIYARDYGSVAAPTAGLHFSETVLSALKENGIDTTFITLHVGLGTFLPVRSVNIRDHKMHTEFFHIGNEAAAKIETAKKERRKVIAVGTTTLRAMEAAWHDGALRRGQQSTDIFIYGDYQFSTADALFTNFHTPESTLLMLVCAFAGVGRGESAGRKLVMETYREAVEQNYKFFSYGDAMLLL